MNEISRESYWDVSLYDKVIITPLQFPESSRRTKVAKSSRILKVSDTCVQPSADKVHFRINGDDNDTLLDIVLKEKGVRYRGYEERGGKKTWWVWGGDEVGL